MAAAGLLLLLTALNAATLLLSRALDRRQELCVRVAFGAGRGRISLGQVSLGDESSRQGLEERAVTGILGALRDAIEGTFDDISTKGDMSPDRAKEAAKDTMNRAQDAMEKVRDRLDFATRSELEELRAKSGGVHLGGSVTGLPAGGGDDASRSPQARLQREYEDTLLTPWVASERADAYHQHPELKLFGGTMLNLFEANVMTLERRGEQIFLLQRRVRG